MSDSRTPREKDRADSNIGMVIGVIVVILAIAGLIYYFSYSPAPTSAPATTMTDTTPADTTTATPPAGNVQQ